MNQKMKVDKKDIIAVIVLAIAMWVIPFFCMGFHEYGLDIPYTYAGSDDFSAIVRTKSIGETGWYWTEDSVGAPYSLERFDFAAVFGTNFEVLVTKIIYLFADNVMTVVNVQYLLIFAFCAISAYCVFRALGIRHLISAFGATLFGLAPYIFERGIAHIALSSCYFVPISILLCVWAFEEDENYLKLGRQFFKNKKNIATLIFALLIANNGMAYYPFFVCFFLCVVALYRWIADKNIKAGLPAVKVICLIVFFLGLALSPIVFYKWQHGSTGITAREVAEAEIYGLKITQFFIPLDGHGIPFLETVISKYNQNMPLVNENRTAYMGLGAIIGFVLSLLTLFIPHNGGSKSEKETKSDIRLQLFSRLILFAILFCTIGGFSSILNLLGVDALRGYNRISIFIMFLCLCILCIYLQKLIDSEYMRQGRYRKVIVQVLCFLVAMICIWEQIPTNRNSDLRSYYKKQYINDKEFVEYIETQLEDGDMVYQLPYHKYPEAGPVNHMNDYHLFIGFIHSKTLKWSYGGMKEREGDQWNEYVAGLPMDERIDVIVSSGFKGIYIDARAYTEEELATLRTEIEQKIKTSAYISQNGDLIFYDLNPYIERNGQFMDEEPLKLEDIQNPLYKLGEEMKFYSENEQATMYVHSGLSMQESEFTWSSADEVSMSFRLEGVEAGTQLHAVFDIAHVFNSQQKVSVKVNGESVYDAVIRDGEDITFDFVASEDGIHSIKMQLPDSVSPKELGISADMRDLGIAIRSFTVDRK